MRMHLAAIWVISSLIAALPVRSQETEDIQTSGADNLADLLRRVPGFDVYELKPSFPLVGARAMTDDSSNLVLVLVAMSFDLKEVERVEVIRGPGSTLHGANAFAAVVSITTLTDRPATSADVVLTGWERGLCRFFGRVRDFHELGLKVRAPLGTPFREYAGMTRPLMMPSGSGSDFGGEMFVRVVSFYLEGSF